MSNLNLSSTEALFSVAAVEEELERIFRDPHFTESAILKKFLSFIVQETIQGRSNCLKEYTIAINVLEKPLSFNPQENGIVRIHAGRLRRALSDYYNDLGRDDQVVISIPKGKYVPFFANRSNLAEVAIIERDLHDGAQQRLVSLVLELGMAQAEVSTEEGELRMRLGHAGEQAREALRELRDLSRGIHPAILTDGGLGKALRAMTRRSPIAVELDLRVEGRLPDRVEISAYYIVAEALTNATKHSGASGVRVCVTAESGEGALRLEVADDGVGGAEFSGGTGLVGLKDRVEALGGRFDLHSPRGGGTTLHVTLPLT